MEVDRIYKGGGKENYKGKKAGKHEGKATGFGFYGFLAKDVANLVAAEKTNRKVRQEERKVEESRKEKVNRTRATTTRHVGYVVILDIGRRIVPIVVVLTKLLGKINSGMEMISIIHQINQQSIKPHNRHIHRFLISLRNQMSSVFNHHHSHLHKEIVRWIIHTILIRRHRAQVQQCIPAVLSHPLLVDESSEEFSSLILLFHQVPQT